MGFMGVVFGLGFIFGLVVGGLFVGLEIEIVNFFLLFICVVGFFIVVFVGVFVFLFESFLLENCRMLLKICVNFFDVFECLCVVFIIFVFIVLNFIVILFWVFLEVVFVIWIEYVFDFGFWEVSLFFMFIGLISVLI